MSDVPAMGYASQIGLGATSPATIAIEFESESIGTDKDIINASGIRGVRDMNYLHRQVENTKIVTGGIEVMPTKSMMDFLLLYILGSPEIIDKWIPLQSEIPSFFMQIDRISKVFNYTKAKINTATFSGSKGEILKMALDIAAEVETEAAAGSATSLIPDLDTPFAFSDGTLTVSAVERFFTEFSLVIDNKLITDRTMNSVNLVDIPSGGFEVSGTLKLPYTTNNEDLYTLIGEIAGTDLTIEFESAGTGKYLEFFMENVIFKGDGTPKITEKAGEVLFDLPFTAMRKSTAAIEDSIVIINADSKPI